MRTVVALLTALILTGCADRYLSAEEDEEFRQACQEHGCTVIPNPQWRMIDQLLRKLGLVPS